MKALLLGFLVLLVGLGPAVAAEKGTVGRGELLLRENCSRCHAIGKEGNSPHPEAPTFRTSRAATRSRTSLNRSLRESSQAT